MRGPDALALATRLHGATKGVDWRQFFAWATREGREAWPSAGEAALALADREPWRGLLALSRDSGRAIDDATLTQALQDRAAGLRTETYWHLLRLLERDAKPGAAVERSLGATPEAKAEAAGEPMATLAFELLGRALGHPAVDRTTLIARLSPAERNLFAFDGSVRVRLRGPEKAAAVGKPPGGARQGDKEAPKDKDRTSKALRTAPRDRRTRTVSDFPPGLASDVLTLTGCRPTGSQWVGLEVRADGAGVRQQVGLLHRS